MKRFLFVYGFIIINLIGLSQEHNTILIEAESFKDKGGWVIDQQFMDEMGSPYLMAHGLGIAVEDATTYKRNILPGKYFVHVRTKNWAAQWSESEAPGKFQITINNTTIQKIFGTESKKWNWSNGGNINIDKTTLQISLHDLTGFNGRCDAILLTTDPDYTPSNNKKELATLRLKLRGLQNEPIETEKYDLVVIGGGMGGICTAISAARLGVKVALIQNRPVLGGNNSSEVRVHLGARIKQEPWPQLGNLVNEIGPSNGGNAQTKNYYEDDKKYNAVIAEKNISLFLNCHANKVITEKGEIETVIAENIATGEKYSFNAPIFADCTGDGTIGFLAGAAFMQGRESQSKFGEPTAPESEDNLTMGASVQWFSEKRDNTNNFPDIKWGLYWNEQKLEAITRGDWNWETGMGIDMTKNFELVRDYGMLVVFSNWSYVKNHSSKKVQFSNEQLKWVAYVAGKRESRRLIGDFILTETDLIERKLYPDGTAPTTWTIDLHYPEPENSALFPNASFKSIAKHIPIYPYPIPYRCLYSKNIDNLFMAGRHISVSHVALGTTRLMRTIGMMGEVVGMAASICKEENANPQDIYETHFEKLKILMKQGVGDPKLPNKQNYNLGNTLQKSN